ncbi:MAG: histidine kinase, partial [Verrucomicrobia bacterium]|nr:histidine kinase [Verrucomicrobiota bacterium]
MIEPTNNNPGGCLLRMPMGTKLTLSFVSIIVIISAVFVVVGIRLIANRVVAEAQQKVTLDLNAAREIYNGRLNRVHDTVRFLADRYLLLDPLFAGDMQRTAEELARIKEREGLDVLTVTDKNGAVLLRTSNPGQAGDSQRADELVRAVLERKQAVAATAVVPAEELRRELPALAERARGDGMMLKAAAPIFDARKNFVGILYGGSLLNGNFDLVDKIKQTVYQDVVYQGKDIGTATIFLDGLRIATNVRNEDGTRAIGTRIADDVYQQVV